MHENIEKRPAQISTIGITLNAVVGALQTADRLLKSYTGPLAQPTGVRPEVEAAFSEEIARLSPAVRGRIMADGRLAVLGRLLDTPFFRNVTRKACEIDTTFDMLSDEASREALDLVIRFRLLLAVFPPEFLNRALGGPMPPARWIKAREHVQSLVDLPKGLSSWAHIFYWGLGVHSLPELCAVEPGDVVLEAGAFNGDSTLYLASLCGPVGHIHAFELVPENHAKLLANLALNEITNVTAINRGLWDRVGELPARFSAAGSRIDADRSPDTVENYASVTTIDSYCSDARLDRLDFIKIDVPGGAEHILMGAKQTLSRFRPRLAVNIHYNEGSDYSDVPKFLMENLTGIYRYYLQHYSRIHRYTILYAAPQSSK